MWQIGSGKIRFFNFKTQKNPIPQTGMYRFCTSMHILNVGFTTESVKLLCNTNRIDVDDERTPFLHLGRRSRTLSPSPRTASHRCRGFPADLGFAILGFTRCESAAAIKPRGFLQRARLRSCGAKIRLPELLRQGGEKPASCKISPPCRGPIA